MNKRYETSSGGIVYRKRGNKIEVLLLRWLNSRNNEELAVPKGHLEGDETPMQTAIREIYEEAGLQIKDLEVVKFLTKLNYTFTAGYLDDNPIIDKDVYLFLVKYTGKYDPIVEKRERFVGYEWHDIDTIDQNKLNVRFDMGSIINRNKTYFI